MGTWADHAISELMAGRECVVHPHGESMLPMIHSGARVNLCPVRPGSEIHIGDAVLVSFDEHTVYLHFVNAVTRDRVQIVNAHGHINGWTERANVHGKVVHVDNGR